MPCIVENVDSLAIRQMDKLLESLFTCQLDPGSSECLQTRISPNFYSLTRNQVCITKMKQ